MKILVQRVLSASVEIENEKIGSIEKGLLLLTCFEKDDQREVIAKAVEKILHLRCFNDESGKMNHNIMQIKGEILSISQFTLSWDGKGGHRPSFELSMAPSNARLFWYEFNKRLRESGLPIQEGRFGAEMKIYSINDGPVTFPISL
jgi:D-tyrosyl-tRNA(Tyr) deacylase